jgi:catechol 2,3-dioxygenase-like lactoylglutathione lyase family enzyme
MASILNHISMIIKDVERTIHLFRDLLGFQVIWHQEKVGGGKLSAMLGIPGFECEMVYLQRAPDGAAVELIRMKHPPIKDNAGLCFGGLGSVGLSMKVEVIEGLHERLTDEGWTPFSKCMDLITPKGVPIRAFCFATDEGVTVELFQEMTDSRH